MRNIGREQKYIGFLLGMVVLMVLCFGLVYVTAEPTDESNPPEEVIETPVQSPAEEEPTPEQETEEPSAEPTTEIPTDEPTQEVTEAPTDAPTETSTNTPVDTQTQAPTKLPTKSPTKGPTKTPVQKPTATSTGSTSVPTEDPNTTPTGDAVDQTGEVVTATPDASATGTLPIETTPIETTPMDTTPPFTLGPINSADLLPESSPQITPGKMEATTDTTVNMNGYVLRIAATWDEYQDNCLDLAAISAFEERYNCKVQFFDLSKETLYNRLLMSCATGITYFDAILVEGTEILVNMEPLGLLKDFSQYMTEEELAAVPASYQKFLSKGSVLYGIPAKAPDVAGIWYNEAMITQYQYTSPLDFYGSGTWTWYQMTSLFREATRDIDKDGYYDTYGIATSSPWYFSVLESARGSLFRFDGTRFLPGATNPVSLQGLSFARKIYANHYVAADYERYFYTGRTPYLAGELSMYGELTSYMEKDKLMFFPYPSESGSEPYVTVATSVPCAAITATATYPEQTAELLLLLYGGAALDNRIEVYCNESGFSQQVKTAYLQMLENFTVDYTNAFDPSGTIQATVLSCLKNRTITAGTMNMYIQPLLEAAIAEKSKEVDLKQIPVEIRW